MVEHEISPTKVTSDPNLAPLSLPAFLVEVRLKPSQNDHEGESLRNEVAFLGLKGVTLIRRAQLFFLRGPELTSTNLEVAARRLLADPVVHDFTIYPLKGNPAAKVALSPSPQLKSLALQPPVEPLTVIDVLLKPGVTDALAETVLAGGQITGLKNIEFVRTAERFYIWSSLSPTDLENVTSRLLANRVIQEWHILQPPEIGQVPYAEAIFAPLPLVTLKVNTVDLAGADDDRLLQISREGILSLDLTEMKIVRAYFQKENRQPTDVELETIAQTWSEHCYHKTFRAKIAYTEQDKDGQEKSEVIDNLLHTYLVTATEAVKQDWLLSAFVDNAGILAFDKDHEVSFKVETHNHPSAIEPFGGANTGVGGVIRDVVGVSAKPIANTDVLCFAPLDLPFTDLPAEVLHPQRVFNGVISGIRDYGNKMGIPTVNGAIVFDPGYLGNPLVFCGTVGFAPRGRHRTTAEPGDAVVVLGGRTGRDGIHGATFSSVELTHETSATLGSAVQIGNPIIEKKFTDAIMIARDEGLYTAITDCGAGGLSSAVGEMGKDIGVEVDLQTVPLKYAGLQPWEIWLSEAQERMVLAVPLANLPRLQELCADEDVEATIIGHFTANKHLQVRWGADIVADIEMEFLHKGTPQKQLTARWVAPKVNQVAPQTSPATQISLERALKALLGHPNIASKESVIRVYDHEILGHTAIKPLVGIANDGPGDATVLRPVPTSARGLVLANGINPRYGLLDPYAMALAVVDEALRNIIAVGGDLSYTAILDNFCWGNPNDHERLGELVRAVRGCHDAALAFGVPFISGKDSFYNEYRDTRSGLKLAIPGTLLISALSIIKDANKTVTMDVKEVGNTLFIVGTTRLELGGSHFYLTQGYPITEGQVPTVNLPEARQTFERLHAAIVNGQVRACHDLSEGGLAVAAAEMAFAGGFGLELDLEQAPGKDNCAVEGLLFSETPSRFLVEVAPENIGAFQETLGNVPHGLLGKVTKEPRLKITLGDQKLIELRTSELKRVWQTGLESSSLHNH